MLTPPNLPFPCPFPTFPGRKTYCRSRTLDEFTSDGESSTAEVFIPAGTPAGLALPPPSQHAPVVGLTSLNYRITFVHRGRRGWFISTRIYMTTTPPIHPDTRLQNHSRALCMQISRTAHAYVEQLLCCLAQSCSQHQQRLVRTVVNLAARLYRLTSMQHVVWQMLWSNLRRHLWPWNLSRATFQP